MESCHGVDTVSAVGEASWNEKITEMRIEEMISPKGVNPAIRFGYFLSPNSVSSIENLPPEAFCAGDEQKLRRNLKFFMWRNPQKQWGTWVAQMHALYQFVWKEAGIYDAIMNSVFTIKQDVELIAALAERWYPMTNTFVFPWGEATITLEDVMVLGGFSAMGSPLFTPLRGEMENTKDALELARSEITKSKSKKPTHSLWMNRFMANGSQLEHEAFLALWLSRFVFHYVSSGDIIPKCILPIAIRLARGTRIALAPGVLAGIYTSLRKLKNSDVNSKGQKISASLQLVQIWAWERFMALQPTANNHGVNQPRFHKWGSRRREVTDVKLALANAEDHFNWQPYTILDKKRSVLMSCGICPDEEAEATTSVVQIEAQQVIVRCVRVSELVGIACIEQYLPHRVAMQFGADQDIPGLVQRMNTDEKTAWKHYNRSTWGGTQLKLISYWFLNSTVTPRVTQRYLEWWKKSASNGNPETSAAGRRKPYKSVFPNAVAYKNFLKEKCLESVNHDDEELALGPPPGFPPKRRITSSDDHQDSESRKCSRIEVEVEGKDKLKEDHLELAYDDEEILALGPPPGFPPKEYKLKEDYLNLV